MNGVPSAEGTRVLLWDLLLLFAITLFLGLSGGTVYFHPDEVLDEAMTALAQHGNPKYFHYPGLVIYAQAGLYGVLFLTARLFGWARTLAEAGDLFGKAPGHGLTVLFSFLGVATAYLVFRRFTGRRAFSLLAGMLVATSLLWVRNSHYLTVDTPVAALGMATVWLTLRFLRTAGFPTIPQALALGAMIGLTTAAKYNGALIAVSVVAPMVTRGWRTPGKLAGRLAVGAAAALLVFAATNPFIFVEIQLFLEHFRSRVVEIQEGRPGFFMSNGWLFHLFYSLGQGYGAAPLGLALIGMIWLSRTPLVERAEKLAVLLFPLVFYLVMGHSRAAFVRHILPVVPFLGVFSALGAAGLWEGIKAATPRRGLRGIAAALLVAAPLPNALLSWRHDLLLAKGDLRRDMEKILRHAEVDWPRVSLYTGRYLVRSVNRSGIRPSQYLFSSYSMRRESDAIRSAKLKTLDLIVLDSFSHDRLLRDASEGHPGQEAPLAVVRISPFRVPKDLVPLSPESTYSPFLPDLVFRDRAGPYIEVYCARPDLAAAIWKSCLQAGVPCVVEPGARGFYWRRLLAHL